MSTLRQRVFSFIRQLSTSSLHEDNASENFIQNYLKGKEIHRNEPDILHGRTPQELPPKTIGDLSHPILCAMTGPDEGLTTVNKQEKHVSVSDPDIHFIDDQTDNASGIQNINPNTSCTSSSHANTLPSNFVPLQKSESAPVYHDSNAELKHTTDNVNAEVEIAGVTNWKKPHNRAYGASTTLYEVHPVTKMNAGEPIADCFAIVARKNSAILVLADGVNWGQKACIAARAAVHGCVDYLNKSLYSLAVKETFTTTDIFRSLLRSFNSAHNLILQEEGMLTTLTAVLVLPLTTPGKFIACCCNVGDSLAYVYNPRYGVRELTQGSHDVYTMRDMRDALGALGPVDGQNPELTNLTLAMTEVEPGDLVFVTSDGISDNLDPVIGKFAGLPNVEAYQRHKLTLLRTEDLLRNGVSGKGPSVKNAKDLVVNLLDFVTRLTAAKRHILEDVDLYVNDVGENLSRSEQRTRRKEVNGKLCLVPGKLDHATVVAYSVGEFENIAS